MTDNFVAIRDLHFRFHGNHVFRGVDLNIKRGQVTAIMGPSGTGKTTLLKLIGGQLCPQQGTIEVEGENVHQLSIKDLYRVRRKMGMLFQTGALFTNLSVFENVAFPIREHTDLTESMIHDLVLMKLEAVGLRGARDLMTAELSGGMSRRVALARALALDPQMILYDEPFTAQDPVTMGVLMKLIKMLNENLNMTTVIVSHDVAETASLSDYIYLISDGKVIGEGTPEELYHTQAPEVRQFMDGLPDGPVPFHYPRPSLQEDFLGNE